MVALETALWRVDSAARAVSGRLVRARLFAERRSARTGRPVRVGMAQRLYALVEPVPPAVPGAARAVEPGDVSTAARWWQDFAAEAAPGDPTGDAVRAVRRRVAARTLFLWWDGDRPVSMAGYVGPVAGIARVAPVYTPRSIGAVVTVPR